MKTLTTVAVRKVEFREAPEPVPGPDDAVVAVEAVGICGSDIHFYTGKHPYSRFPNVQGHEFAGRVLELPSGYDGPITVGQRVAVEPLVVCGTCLPCRRGRSNLCVNMRTFGAHIDGGLQERIAVPAHLLHDVGDLTPALAALVEPVSIGLHAARRGGVEAGDTVVVLGAGPIGQAILLAALDAGARVMAVDLEQSRLDLALELGAERAIVAGEDMAGATSDWTDAEGPLVVFEATGVPRVLEQAIDIVAPSGTVVVVGLSRDPVTIPMVEFTRKELKVVGSRNNAGVFDQASQLVQRRPDSAEKLISHRFPFAEGAQAFELALTDPAHTEKVVITLHKQ